MLKNGQSGVNIVAQKMASLLLQMELRNTEKPSRYEHLEKMDTAQLLQGINNEDKTVPLAVEKQLPQIEALVNEIVANMQLGGRLFYMGAGTSGRLGIVDASECPPTFGVEQGLVIGIIAGGDGAIRKAVEFAEDDRQQGYKDLEQYNINASDVVVGITASGTTPYVLGAIEACNAKGITTGGISCNANSPLGVLAKFAVEVDTGPEFVTGSTRMKAGTAQKLVLNMITTATMIRLGKVKGNRMVDMQLTNQKLIERGSRMIMDAKGLDYETAKALLLKNGSVRKALDA
jgi:N-acetylmuramic acid 6-phosphate etherase